MILPRDGLELPRDGRGREGSIGLGREGSRFAAEPPSLGGSPGDSPGNPAVATDRADLSDYTILEPIGSGLRGSVFRARDRSGRLLALKIFNRGVGVDPEVLRRFTRSGDGRISHPSLTRAEAVGESEGKVFLAMPLHEGDSLEAILRELEGGSSPRAHLSPLGPGAEGRLRQGAIRHAVSLFAEAAEALERAHAAGIIHGRLSPANLILTPGGRLMLTDFGGESPAGSQRRIGHGVSHDLATLPYRAPEQIDPFRAEIDGRVDLYSLGAILYHLLTRRPPFSGSDPREMREDIADGRIIPPSRLEPLIPPEVEAVILRAMAIDPGSRYPTAANLALDLRRLLSLESTAAGAERQRAVALPESAVAPLVPLVPSAPIAPTAPSAPVVPIVSVARAPAEEETAVEAPIAAAPAEAEAPIRESQETEAASGESLLWRGIPAGSLFLEEAGGHRENRPETQERDDRPDGAVVGGARSVLPDALHTGETLGPSGGAPSVLPDAIHAGERHEPSGGARSVVPLARQAGETLGPDEAGPSYGTLSRADSVARQVPGEAGETLGPPGGARSVLPDALHAGERHEPSGGARSVVPLARQAGETHGPEGAGPSYGTLSRTDSVLRQVPGEAGETLGPSGGAPSVLPDALHAGERHEPSGGARSVVPLARQAGETHGPDGLSPSYGTGSRAEAEVRAVASEPRPAPCENEARVVTLPSRPAGGRRRLIRAAIAATLAIAGVAGWGWLTLILHDRGEASRALAATRGLGLRRLEAAIVSLFSDDARRALDEVSSARALGATAAEIEPVAEALRLRAEDPLLADLSHPRGAVRLEAARGIEREIERGERPEAALDALEPLLLDEDPAVRAAAMAAVARCGSSASLLAAYPIGEGLPSLPLDPGTFLPLADSLARAGDGPARAILDRWSLDDFLRLDAWREGDASPLLLPPNLALAMAPRAEPAPGDGAIGAGPTPAIETGRFARAWLLLRARLGGAELPALAARLAAPLSPGSDRGLSALAPATIDALAVQGGVEARRALLSLGPAFGEVHGLRLVEALAATGGEDELLVLARTSLPAGIRSEAVRAAAGLLARSPAGSIPAESGGAEKGPLAELLDLLRRDPEPEVRRAALDSLSSLGREALGAGARCALHDPILSLEALDLLELLPQAETVHDLAPLIRGAAEPLRSRAVAAAGRLRDPAALGPLALLLFESDRGVRARALEAMARIAPARALAAAAGILPSGAEELRLLALEVCRAPLEPQESPAVRALAVREALGLRGPEDSPIELLEARRALLRGAIGSGSGASGSGASRSRSPSPDARR